MIKNFPYHLKIMKNFPFNFKNNEEFSSNFKLTLTLFLHVAKNQT